MRHLRSVLVALACVASAPVLAQTARPTPPPVLQPAPSSPHDGQWRGTSDGGACNAPLEVRLSIEYGFVDGTASDASARGPEPNQRKAPPPEPTAALWQLHGLAGTATSFTLLAAASTRGQVRQDTRVTVHREGDALILSEGGGCGRTARLTRG
ncbi:MAG: hypothetical protein FJX02_11195 [Alphaproteobacteria bacterium]|nr:hypothetical protein [Alphaproteobacteria bacterium]